MLSWRKLAHAIGAMLIVPLDGRSLAMPNLAVRKAGYTHCGQRQM